MVSASGPARSIAGHDAEPATGGLAGLRYCCARPRHRCACAQPLLASRHARSSARHDDAADGDRDGRIHVRRAGRHLGAAARAVAAAVGAAGGGGDLRVGRAPVHRRPAHRSGRIATAVHFGALTRAERAFARRIRGDQLSSAQSIGGTARRGGNGQIDAARWRHREYRADRQSARTARRDHRRRHVRPVHGGQAEDAGIDTSRSSRRPPRSAEPGGTTRYPGLTCDVPVPLLLLLVSAEP